MKKFYFLIITVILVFSANNLFSRTIVPFKLSNSFKDTIASETNSNTPASFKLYQNYPNPFNPTTEIKYDVAEKSHVVLKVYNALGSEVATLVDDVKPAGTYKAFFNASNLFSGVYFYQLKANNYTKVKKMILLK